MNTSFLNPSNNENTHTVIELNERIRFTIFISVMVHVFLLLGVGIAYRVQNSTKSVEVTFVNIKNNKHNNNADFISQNNQQGSGTEQKKLLQYAKNSAVVNGKNIQDVLQKISKITNHSPKETNIDDQLSKHKLTQNVIVTSSLSREVVNLIKKTAKAPFAVVNPFANNAQVNNQIVENLEARLAKENQELAKQQKIFTTHTLSAKKDIAAKYIYDWVNKIEHTGNAYYPQIAKQFGLQGSLQMLVAIKQNGTIDHVRILQSSGFKRLDDAAVRIVRMSAPFGEMPDNMAKEIYKLQIIRTWVFSENNFITK